MHGDNVEFGLRGSYGALAKKTLMHIQQLPSSSVKSCSLFNKQWDLSNNQLLVDPDFSKFELKEDQRKALSDTFERLGITKAESMLKDTVYPSFFSPIQVNSCLPGVLFLSHS